MSRFYLGHVGRCGGYGGVEHEDESARQGHENLVKGAAVHHGTPGENREWPGVGAVSWFSSSDDDRVEERPVGATTTSSRPSKIDLAPSASPMQSSGSLTRIFKVTELLGLHTGGSCFFF